MHECPECGMAHGEAEPEPAPVIVEPGPNENDVKIAEIEAEASVKREEIYTEQRALELVAENERLRGELQGVRETLDRLQPPEPEPEPVVVSMPVADPAPAEPVAAPPDAGPPKPRGKKSPGWWDSY